MSAIPALKLAAAPAALPLDLEAEQAVLGCVLYDNEGLHYAEALEPAHFSEPFHARLWGVICERIGRGDQAEPVSMAKRFDSDPALSEMGGLGYLADLVDRAPPTTSVSHFAKAITDAFLRREIMRLSDDAKARAGDQSEPARAHLEAIEAELFSLAEGGQREVGFQEFGQALDGALEIASAAYQRDGSVSGLSTGLIDLDAKLGGLHPSDLIILAGRPSMGKTALATNIAHAAAKAGKSVGFFSLEMSAEQLGMRLLADVTGISGDRIRKGDIDQNEFRRLHDAAAEIRSLPLHIDATGGLSIAKLAARARRLKRRKGLDLIIVDYLQLASGTDKSKGSGRVQEVSEITAALKALAKDLGVPVLALSQLPRQVESRDDKRPQLSDLRESGSIEQDADVVAFVYREAYYLGRAEPKEGKPEHLEWEIQMADAANKADVIIGKARHGPIGTVKLHFNEDLTRFGNLAREGFSDSYGYRDPSQPRGVR